MIASFVADTVPGEGNEKGGEITGRKKKREGEGRGRRHNALTHNVVYRALAADGVAPAVLCLASLRLDLTCVSPVIPLLRTLC